MGREYNLIYSRLVEREDDVVGTIAYSIYKTDKIAFLPRPATVGRFYFAASREA